MQYLWKIVNVLRVLEEVGPESPISFRVLGSFLCLGMALPVQRGEGGSSYSMNPNCLGTIRNMIYIIDHISGYKWNVSLYVTYNFCSVEMSNNK